MLHHDRDLFEKAVLDTAAKYRIAPVIIEKDYYVTLFLREIAEREPGIVFKGGTSLSKCYHLIERFSEDIDLNMEGVQKPTEGRRRRLIMSIKEIMQEQGFVLKNAQDIFSRRDYNRFEFDVHSLFSSEYVKHDLIIETAVFMRSYPCEKRQVSSYVYEYLRSIGRDDIIHLGMAEPFEISVQTIERTFTDKLFAVCDYYLAGRTEEHSRHLYDLYKMAGAIRFDDSLRELFENVREERKQHKVCLSAQDGVDVRECLQEIIRKDVYKKDYEAITQKLIFESVSYDMIRDALQKIVEESPLFN